MQLTALALCLLSQWLSQAVIALDNQNGTSTAHSEYAGSKLLSSMCATGMWQ